MEFLSTLEPQVFLYILSSISEGLNALGELCYCKMIYYLYYERNISVSFENVLKIGKVKI